MWLTPFKEFFDLLGETAKSPPFQDTIKPACKAMIQYNLDVLFEKILNVGGTYYDFLCLLSYLKVLPIISFSVYH